MKTNSWLLPDSQATPTNLLVTVRKAIELHRPHYGPLENSITRRILALFHVRVKHVATLTAERVGFDGEGNIVYHGRHDTKTGT